MNALFTTPTKGLWLLAHGLVMVLLTELTLGLLVGVAATPSERLLLRATLVLVLALQLQPRPQAQLSVAIGLSLLWSMGCGIAVLVGQQLSPGSALPLRPVLLMASGTTLLVFVFSNLTLVLSVWLNDRRQASRTCLLVLLLSVSLPLWAAPLAAFGFATAIVDAIIALCPISYLATLADIDYLRGAWPYQNLPYGGLRYNYVDPALVTLALLVCAATLTALNIFSGRDSTSTPFSLNRTYQEMKP